MKKSDAFVLLAIVLLILPFALSDNLLGSYKAFNHEHGIVTSFIKFALLATFGELSGLRIKTGKYYEKGFGILPRAVVWGFIGVTIKMAFVIFASGTPVLLEYLGIDGATRALQGPMTFEKVEVAFFTSVAMNVVYAPVMMTFHKISDIHILANGGRLAALVSPVRVREIFLSLNWDVQWGFVFKKTIPFFWIPAHTVTFLLPPDYQVLFAALLGIALGSILAFAGKMESKK